MASRLDHLSAVELEHIEHARLRAQRRAERRELVTEYSVSLAFIATALAGAFWLPHARGSLGTSLWLAGLCAVLVRVEFEVGEGRTRPVQLIFVPMLLVLSPGLIPLAVLLAHLPAPIVKVLRREWPAQRLVLISADSWFAVAPAAVMLAAGTWTGAWTAAGLCLIALLALIAGDVLVSCLRMRVGLGIDPRAELRGFAWVYLVDACLAPVGFFAGMVGAAHPALLAGVLPVAGLLAIFARERRGRIANALALQQVAQESRDRLQSIVQNASDCILIVGADGAIKTLTGSVQAIFGPEWGEAEGGPLLERVHPDDAARVDAFLAGVAGKPPDEPQEAEWRMRYADGAYRHISAAATNLLDDPRVASIVITARDVEDRKALEEQLRHRAFHDALTGLANRALFYDRIEHALSGGDRSGTQAAVLFVDLDDFKAANDARGHAEGDQLLREVARRLVSCLRSADTAARLGGDEFGVLIEGVTDPEAVTATAARVLEILAQPILLASGPATVSASIGIAISAQQDRGVEEFLRKADLAMYEAKRNGKRRAERYHPGLELLDGPGTPRGQWFARNDEQRAEIEDVLADPNAIEIVFQPIMDLRTGQVAGYESLSRFDREPRRAPNVWFAQAHRCGLGYALEAKAIALALATPGRPAGAHLTFNLSPSSLLSDEVMRSLPGRLDGLVVEITENELISDDPAITAALSDLRGRGVRVAVDDTGAGYAGLTHVMRLQPDVIKLDRALTTGVDKDLAKAPLIGSFVRYARDIAADVCAEGIESLEELECLASLDVAYGQGYALARPSPPWTTVDPQATAACLRSFQASLAIGQGPSDHDQRLEAITRRLATVTTHAELDAWLIALAGELQAGTVRIVGPEGAAQSPAGDGSRLALPIRRARHAPWHLELHSRDGRPWSRFQIGRARIICNQLGLVLDRDAVLQD